MVFLGLIMGVLNSTFKSQKNSTNAVSQTLNTNDFVRVKISHYTSNPELSTCIPQKVFASMMASIIKGEDYIYIHKTTLRKIEEEYAIKQSKK
jgi:hypothetical protein